ncbi:MAG: hypothetical protein JSS57_04425 [Proteobacteria bacterium]|nr:hypothetical protein [Pseudomonadota bacterium]
MHDTTNRLFQFAKDELKIVEPGRIAAKLGVSQQTLTNWMTRGMSDRAMLDAEHAIGVPAVWLKYGEGTTPKARHEVREVGARYAVPIPTQADRVIAVLEAALQAVGLELAAVGNRPTLFKKISRGLLHLENVKKSAPNDIQDSENAKRHDRFASENKDSKLRTLIKKTPAGKTGAAE